MMKTCSVMLLLLTLMNHTFANDQNHLFLQGLVSTDLEERDIGFSRDGQLMAHTLMNGRHGIIVLYEREGNSWGEGQVASFSGEYSDIEPFFAADGFLYFASNRPNPHSAEKPNYDIWRVAYSASSGSPVFGEPENLGPAINSAGEEFYPSLTDSGDMVITTRREGGPGDEDVFISRLTESGYGPLEPLGPGVNTAGPEFNAMISPDGSFVIYSGWGREGGPGGGDLYISYRDEAGVFSNAILLPEPFNTSALDYCPALSVDGKTLFFSSKRVAERQGGATLQMLKQQMRMPLNGRGDIFFAPLSDFRQNRK